MDSGISLPGAIAGMVRGESKPYQFSPNEWGVETPYQNEEVLATIYIRNLDSPQEWTPARIVHDTLMATKQLEQSGTYADVKIYESADDSATPGWSKGAFTAKNKGRFLVSYVYGAIKENFAVKVRITTSNFQNESIEKFVVEFQKIVNDAKAAS